MYSRNPSGWFSFSVAGADHGVLSTSVPPYATVPSNVAGVHMLMCSFLWIAMWVQPAENS